MQLKEIRSGSVVVELDPGVCLAIAEACWAAGDHASDNRLATHGGTFTILRGAFEALAALGAAGGYTVGGELAEWTPDRVRAEWHFLPATEGQGA